MLKILSFTNKTKTVDDHNPLIIITLNVEQYDHLKTLGSFSLRALKQTYTWPHSFI